MKPCLFLIVTILCIYSCKNKSLSYLNEENDRDQDISIQDLIIEDLIIDSTLNVRALELFKGDNECLYLNADGTGGRIHTYQNSIGKDTTVVYNYFEKFNDTISVNYRGAAITELAEYGLSIGNPAYILKYNHDMAYVVYNEHHEKVFYDAIEFWNDNEGIAIGDPTSGCISIVITRDGGDTWTKIDCSLLPPSKEGEAAFAASDTNIAIIGDKTWVATGGVYSRILYSPDKGHSWTVFETPMIQGKPTTGIYSIDFYDALNGFAIGGDYTNPEANVANKMRTEDGGETWELVADGKHPGYRSCVQYVPNSKASELVAVGFNGIEYSHNAGDTWNHLSDEGFYTIRFLNDSIAYAAGKGRISRLLFKDKL